MGRDIYICTIDYVAKRIGENLELLEEIAANPDNIEYGEMIDVVTGPDESIIAFTSRGIENLQEFIADVRSSQGGMRQFLIDQNCDTAMIECIMTDKPR
jgi:ATP-dependent RNA circularization protein (DNA/RNA ligase family)